MDRNPPALLPVCNLPTAEPLAHPPGHHASSRVPLVLMVAHTKSDPKPKPVPMRFDPMVVPPSGSVVVVPPYCSVNATGASGASVASGALLLKMDSGDGTGVLSRRMCAAGRELLRKWWVVAVESGRGSYTYRPLLLASCHVRGFQHALLDLPLEYELDVNVLAGGSDTVIYDTGMPVLHTLAQKSSHRDPEVAIRIAERQSHEALHLHLPIASSIANASLATHDGHLYVPVDLQHLYVPADEGRHPHAAIVGPLAGRNTDLFAPPFHFMCRMWKPSGEFLDADHVRNMILVMLHSRVSRADGSGFDPETAHYPGAETPSETIEIMERRVRGSLTAQTGADLESIKTALFQAIERRIEYRKLVVLYLLPALANLVPVLALHAIVLCYLS
jgi:hypothetical protein